MNLYGQDIQVMVKRHGLELEYAAPGDGVRRYCIERKGRIYTAKGPREAWVFLNGYDEGCERMKREGIPVGAPRNDEASSDRLEASLRETLRALEAHLDESGDRDRCPCDTNEVARAKAVLAEGDE